jgi:glycosyltransferase involved in cell wall biosynthesis
VRLVILGEGPQRGLLEELASRLGITAQLSMPGFNDNPYACMSRADVFVLSSAYEGFPNVLVEALACGAKVVSTDCRSGPAEILDGGRFGGLVPVGDARSLAYAIRAALDDTSFRAQSALARASEFSVERAVTAYMQLLFPNGLG